MVNSGGSGNMVTDDRGMYRVYGLMPGAYAIGVTPATAGATSETRLLSDAEMRAAMADLARKDNPTPAATGAGGPPAPGGGLGSGGRTLQLAPPGPPPVAPVSGRAVGFATVYYPGTVIDTDAATVTVGLGQEVQGIDLALMLVPTSRVEGRVVMPDGQPALRPQVQLWPITATTNSSPTLSARMLPDGTFQAMGVAPGRYSLFARVTEQPPPPPPPGLGGPPLQVVGARTTRPDLLGAAGTRLERRRPNRARADAGARDDGVGPRGVRGQDAGAGSRVSCASRSTSSAPAAPGIPRGRSRPTAPAPSP